MLAEKGVRDFQRHQERLYDLLENPDLYVRFEEVDRTMIVNSLLFDELSFVSTEYKLDPVAPFDRLEQLHEEDKDSTAVIRGNKSFFTWLREWAYFQSNFDGDGFPCMQWPGRVFTLDTTRDEYFNKTFYRPTGESLVEAYARTLSADVMFDNILGQAVRVPKSSDGINEIISKELKMVYEISSRLEGRSFAVSSMGFTSLVPAEARSDDRIALVQGSQAPFILRPSASGFHFIGLAYVHGIADGELWKNSDKSLPLREIRII